MKLADYADKMDKARKGDLAAEAELVVLKEPELLRLILDYLMDKGGT